MVGRTKAPAQPTVSGEIYGVGLRLAASDKATLQRMRDWLAPLFVERPPREGDFPIELNYFPDDTYELVSGDRLLSDGTFAETIDSFDRISRQQVAFNAPDHTFFHAGVVVHSGRAIVIPGSSFSGKTTLTAALVKAGAVYYSDEYAVIAPDGLVHPYPKPLALRRQDGSRRQTSTSVTELGAKQGADAAPLALVVASRYRREAEWSPVELTPAEAVLELIGNTFADEAHMPAVMQSLRQAFDRTGAIGLKGERGEADAVAADLLMRVEALSVVNQRPG